MSGQFLTFFVGAEEYAIGILRIREILEFAGATRVPGTPPSVLGVINLRGRVVPVIDLSVRFGGAQSRVTKRTCVVLVEIEVDGDTMIMGLLSDSVHEVVEIPDEAIEPPPAFGTRVTIDFLRGVGRHGDRFVLVLDIDRLLTSVESESAERIAAGEALPAIA